MTGNGDRPVGRLIWAPAREGRILDGAFWPSSGDAVAELSSLIPLVAERLHGPVTRVSLNIDAWGPNQPRRIRIGAGFVRLGWFHAIDQATITLGRGTYDRVILAVVPSDLDEASGRELLRRLSDTARWPDTAAAALAV
jgi:hypothetical protein